MNTPRPDLRDPVIDGFPNSVAKPKGTGGRGKTLFLAGVALLSLGWAAVSVFLFARRERSLAPQAPLPRVGAERPLFGAKIDLEHFQRIRTGMKLEDVEIVLGGPPGFYESLEGFRFEKEPRIDGKGRDDGLGWYGRTACIKVLPDDSGAVIDKEYCPGKRLPH